MLTHIDEHLNKIIDLFLALIRNDGRLLIFVWDGYCVAYTFVLLYAECAISTGCKWNCCKWNKRLFDRVRQVYATDAARDDRAGISRAPVVKLQCACVLCCASFTVLESDKVIRVFRFYFSLWKSPSFEESFASIPVLSSGNISCIMSFVSWHEIVKFSYEWNRK